jgi:dolichol-phosphate mannosyltransferase
VQHDFTRMTERSRITRGLIDWLGYPRDYIEFAANPRMAGEASYSIAKLFKLAIDSVISLSTSPLYVAMYIGAVVLPLSLLVGVVMIINELLGDPLSLHATGSAYVIMLMLFLIGVLLVSQGIIGLYLSHIHTETQNRPLYIVDEEASEGLSSNTNS